MDNNITLVTTIKERCRMCYTCIRSCPAKAIRVSNGQAEVIPERCIGCGHCVLVCSQKAKKYYGSIDETNDILKSDIKTIAIVAPSFPAAFQGINAGRLVSMIKELGFDHVCEVAFGADFVAHAYKELVFNNPDKSYIATTCPGIVSFVEKYHPILFSYLAPIVSPMIATSRALRIIYGDIKTVFIGPCISKKAEALKYPTEDGSTEIASVLTFQELIEMFEAEEIDGEKLTPRDFDPPKPGLGALFPLRGGMLQAADMRVNLLNSHILTADGKEDFVRALDEYHNKKFDSKLLEVLCCQGCIMGAGMPSEEKQSYFARRTAVSNYVKSRFEYSDLHINRDMFHGLLNQELDMKAIFRASDIRFTEPPNKKIVTILEKLGKYTIEDELNCGACGYETCREHAQAIYAGLAENEMCLPYTIERLKNSLEDLKISKTSLEKTQEALFNAEKLASMGQLSAGIAHEINNPLGVILLNASGLLEEISETPELEEYKEDIDLIVEQAKRCKKIVSGLLNFSRKNTLDIELTNIDKLIKNSLKTIIKPEEVNIIIDSNFNDPIAEVHGDKITQVLVNLIVNAIDAMQEKGTINIQAYDNEDKIYVKIKDEGSGIQQKYINKIFEPLFTTKQIGKGTGLGLAVSYGIIKTHKGNITVKTNAEPEKGPTWTEFTISLPRKN
ncbi:MAG: 4Fe-4S binding protein [Victivallales bacterium]|nr:4Fe-4S binding protein [Victivallales bacterium]MCF7888840.1 4Fe-4S binding protein [Victivallales bacterium]